MLRKPDYKKIINLKALLWELHSYMTWLYKLTKGSFGLMYVTNPEVKQATFFSIFYKSCQSRTMDTIALFSLGVDKRAHLRAT